MCLTRADGISMLPCGKKKKKKRSLAPKSKIEETMEVVSEANI